ncbi:MAG: leucine-rich repeat domain-containing protein, partial [Oscillospiraceae bacterium]|nr:leucine-rich repeat domain-containing protein [Oscillospiraceae bacterium]
MKLMRILSGILASVIATGCLLYSAPPKTISDPVLNAYAASVDDLTFTVYEDSATLTKCSTSATDEIEIPEKFNDVPVTVIAPRAFQDCTAITSIKMPDSIEIIGEQAFDGSRRLSSINISKSVRTIPDNCFKACECLGDIVLPYNIKSVSINGFFGASINSITIMNPSLVLSFLENYGSVKTVYGYPDSTAETYAKKHGKPFIALEGTPPTTTTTTWM